MNAAAPPRSRLRRRLTFAGRALLLALALLLLVLLLLQTQFVRGLLLRAGGALLDLQLEADHVDLRLRGTPRLQLDALDVRRTGETGSLLQAQRAVVELPWSTLRSFGKTLVFERIELNTPRLDLPALQRWLAMRPPGKTRIPTLKQGLHIRDGQLAGNGWHIDRIDLALPSLAPQTPLNAKLHGRYVDAGRRLPFDFRLGLSQPASHGKLALNGSFRIKNAAHQLPARLQLTADVHHDDAIWSLQPIAFKLQGEGLLPTMNAHGSLTWGQQLQLQLAGALAQWPAQWPALPSPLAESRSPLPFRLGYAGATDFTGEATLLLRQDATVFNAGFRLPAVLAWGGRDSHGTPLPPLHGSLTMPKLEISGAHLQGVEIEIDNTDTP